MKKNFRNRNGFSSLEILISIFIFSLTMSSLFVIYFGNQFLITKAKIFEEIFWRAEFNLEKAKARGLNNFETLNSFKNLENDFEEVGEISLVYDYTKKIKSSVKSLRENLNPAELTSLVSNWQESIGSDTCLHEINFNDLEIISKFGLGTSRTTDIEVVRGTAYVSVNDNNTHDFFVLDVRDPKNISLISSLNTGVGLNSLEVVGRYIFSAHDGTTNQLQLIDVLDLENPSLVSSFALPSPSATTSAETIFYRNKKIFLGAKKHPDGHEFHVIDVSDPLSPVHRGAFEVDTQVNDIVLKNDFAFLAVPNPRPLRVLDLTNPSNIQEIFSYETGGPTTQGGQTLSLENNLLTLGRSVGLVNENYPELFLFDVESPSETEFLDQENIMGSVREVLMHPNNLIVANLRPGEEFQIWTVGEEQQFVLSGATNLSLRPVQLDCDSETIFVLTEDKENTLVILKKI